MASIAAKKVEWSPEEREAWKPPEHLTVSEWADKYRILLAETSNESGPWRTARVPYLREIMDSFSDPHIEKIVFEAGSQLGKTEFLYNCLGYLIHQDPGSTLLVFPTIDLARSLSKSRIQPMIAACDPLRERKPANDDLFTNLEMLFPGMALNIVGANSEAGLAARPCRYILLDECSLYPEQTQSGANPINSAMERQKTIWNKKTLLVSTPKYEDGQITRERKSCDVTYRYYVPCPYCGAMQILAFPNIKWPKEISSDSLTYAQEVWESAYYECTQCHAKIYNNQRPMMLASGEWRPDQPPNPSLIIRSKGYHLSSLYSPFLTWGDIAEKFIKSKDYPDLLKDFINFWLAEVWVETIHRKEEADILSHKIDLPPLTVPQQAIVLTLGADVQKDGIYYIVRAWAADYTSWLIRYGYLMSWDNFAQIIFEDIYPGESGAGFKIWRAAIDTGGSEGPDETVSITEEVYTWLRDHSQGVAFGVKGASRSLPNRLKHSIIDKMPGKTGRVIPGGLILWNVDTVKFKELYHYRLQVEEGKAQCIYLHSDTGMDYARQITAEEKRRNKKGQVEWHQLRYDNHYFDCEVYCAATVDPEWWGGLRVLGGKPPNQPTKAPRPKAKPPGWLPRTAAGWIQR